MSVASPRKPAKDNMTIGLGRVQEFLLKDSSADILLHLLCASSSSIFCLSCLKHDMPRLVNAIESVEDHLRSHDDPLALFLA